MADSFLAPELVEGVIDRPDSRWAYQPMSHVFCRGTREPYSVCLTAREVIERVATVQRETDQRFADEQRLNRELRDAQQAASLAWGIIANVSGGDWTQQSEEWKREALAWRNAYVMPEMAEPSDGAGSEG